MSDYKSSIKCPHCGDRISTFHVPAFTFRTFNPSKNTLGKIVGGWDNEQEGFCGKCGGSITSEDFIKNEYCNNHTKKEC